MNITKEEIKSAGLQHVEDVKGGNACYDSFVAGVEYMLQKLEQCNVSGRSEQSPLHCGSCGSKKVEIIEKCSNCGVEVGGNCH